MISTLGPGKFKDLFLILVIALTVISVFYQTLFNDFVYDDWFAIQGNIGVRKTLNPLYYFAHPIGFHWPSEGSDADTYRPMQYVVFALIYNFFGLDPLFFHLVSLVIHALNAVLVFVLLGLIFQNKGSIIPFLGALIFGLHPVAIESVAWATQQGGVLAMFFSLLTLIILLSHDRDREDNQEKSFFYYFSLFLLSSLAVFFKEHAVVLPAFYVTILFFQGAGGFRDRLTSLRKKWPEFIAISIPVALALAARQIYLPSFAQQSPWGGGRVNMFFTMLSAFKYYIKLLFWPNPLSVNYDEYPVFVKFLNFEVWSSAFILLFIAIGAYALYRSVPIFSLGVFFFFAALLPVSNVIFPMKQVLNERFLYFALPGFIIAVFGILLFIYENLKGAYKKFSLAIFTLAISGSIVVLSMVTIHRLKDWEDDFSLWGHEFSTPLAAKSWRTHNNFAIILEMNNMHNEAEPYLYKTIELSYDPNLRKESIKGLANVLSRNGKAKKAIELLKSALKEFPDDPGLSFALTFTHFYGGEYTLAEKGFRKVVDSGKYDMSTFTYMILSETLSGANHKQIQKDIDAISIEPLRRAMPNLIKAKVEMYKENWGAAIEALDRVREEKNLPLIEPYLWRGEVLEHLERLDEAEESYMTVLLFYPRSMDAVKGLRRVQNQNQPL